MSLLSGKLNMMHSSNIGLLFYGYATEMFPPIDPVILELINLGAIVEEMCNVISFTTVVTGFTLSLTLMLHDQLLHGITLCSILY